MKYIIVTGGVLSGIGKGITISSIGRLLKSRGFSVSIIKIDPYINCDAGTMNPFQHGEVFVLDDGGEVDLDLGNYERFLNVDLSSDHNITTGKVFRSVIEKERRGDYLGKTVQIIPHITNEIKERIKAVAEKYSCDIILIELGGTVGDIESAPFLEAVRQLHREAGNEENCIFVHTTLVPRLNVVGEQKTKPTQHSVKELRAIGIQPDFIIARATEPLEYDIKRKIALFCDVALRAVISAPDSESIYKVPLLLDEQGLTDTLLKRLGMTERENTIEAWKQIVDRLLNPSSRVDIVLVGKYTHLKDSYMSHFEALNHVGAEFGIQVVTHSIEADDVENLKDEAMQAIKSADGILVPGGFGDRGSEGKVMAAKYARENNIPFLGICLGFQLAVVEFARNVLGKEDANSSEFNSATSYPVIDLLPEQRDIKDKGATMRLGLLPITIKKNTKGYEIYKSEAIKERHRHRSEVNPDMIEELEKNGLKFSGKSTDGRRMELLEYEDHPFYVASQFHPELRSRLEKPAPLFKAFVEAAMVQKAKSASNSEK